MFDEKLNSKPSYYIIEDLSTWAKNDPVRSTIERFTELADAIKKFNEYRVKDYDYSDGYAKLTLGANSNGSEIDVIQVRNNENNLITDFTKFLKFTGNQLFIQDLQVIAKDIEIEKVRIYERRNLIEIGFSNWDNPYFVQSNETEQLDNLDDEEEPRVCSECGKIFKAGFCFADGAEYYCSLKCLVKNMTIKEFFEEVKEDAAYMSTFNDGTDYDLDLLYQELRASEEWTRVEGEENDLDEEIEQ